jgi:hypothetical protein
MELLYVAHLQPTVAVPFTLADVDLVTRYLDLDNATASPNQVRYSSDLLRISSPGGNGSFLTFESMNNSGGGFTGFWPAMVQQLGTDVGIQVGVDNTAVTPTDRRLSQRIGHGSRPADGAPVVFEQYITGDDADYTMNAATKWTAAGFTPLVSHRVTSVLVKIWKTGAPGNLTVSIKGGSPNTAWPSPAAPQPYVTDCPDLAVGTILQAAIPGATPGALTECTFGTPVDLYAGHRYFIVCRALGSSGGNSVQQRYDSGGATYERLPEFFSADVFCEHMYSTDSGVTWNPGSNTCFMFQEKGQSVGELDYGGCEFSNLVFANPNGSFDIRRYFTNHSGEDRVVKEAGICAVAHRSGSASSFNQISSYPFLIAHDYQDGAVWVAPITVHDTEILRVTYTPSITV